MEISIWELVNHHLSIGSKEGLPFGPAQDTCHCHTARKLMW
jgi:hypothetical protein